MDRASRIILTRFRKRAGEALWVCLLLILLCVVYVYALVPYYAYSGITLAPTSVKFLEAFLCVAVTSVLLPSDRQNPSSWVLRLLVILIIVPFACVYAMKGADRGFFYLGVGGFVLTVSLVRLMPKFRLKKLPKPFLALTVLMSCTAVSYILLYVQNGLPSLKATDLTRVYEIRESYVTGWVWLEYLLKWQGKIVNAALLWFGYYRRSRFLMVAAICLQGLIFLWTGHKVYLFMFALYGAVVYAAHRDWKLPRLTQWAGLVVAIATVPLLFHLSTMPASLLVRRAFVVPAINSYYYHDFFSKEDKVYLANSSLSMGLVENPYAEYKNVPSMIGSIYRSEGANSNVGYIADGYMHFGALGIIVVSIMLGFILVFTDSIVRGNRSPFTIAMATIPLLSIVNSSLLTSLFTHGVVLSWFIIYFVGPRSNDWRSSAKHSHV